MLSELKEFLINGETDISKLDLKFIRNYFNKILYYNESDDEKPVSLLKEVYLKFNDVFKFSGTIYRGIFANLNILESFKPNEIFSFTSNINVADNFALRGDDGCGYVLTQDVKDGLNFAELLNVLLEKKILLEDDIGNFVNEDEVLSPIKTEYKIELKFDLLSK